MVALSSRPARPDARFRLTRRALGAVAVVLGIVLFCTVVPAFAGQASSGELFYYPCTSCHPVQMIPGTETPTKKLPNGFTGHEIVLVGHDKLGKGDAACMTCHDDPARNPGMLKLADGSLIDIKIGDIALVCYRCHSTKYKEFKAGTHGKHKASCVAAGCHDPHTPGFIYAPPLMPFIGTGFQFKVLSQREAFSPLAPPAPDAPVQIPWWFTAITVVGIAVVGGITGTLVMGRSKR
jgi:hypothetical protein